MGTAALGWPASSAPQGQETVELRSTGQPRAAVPTRIVEPNPLFRSRMSLIVNLQHVLDGKLGVALGGGKALVAEHLLDRAQVSAFLQHVSSEGMPQRVRMNIGRQPLGNRDFLDDAAHAAGSEPPAPPIDQQCRRTFLAF